MKIILDHASTIINTIASLLAIFGVTVAPFFLDLNNPAIAIPLAALLLLIGALLGFRLREKIADTEVKKEIAIKEYEEKKAEDKKIDDLERIFLGMSDKQKQYVKKALDEGEVLLPSFDPSALVLCELGILGTPPYGMIHGNTIFSIQPSVIKEINEHKEWLNSNNPSQEVSA